MQYQDWLNTNYQAIARRLNGLRRQPNGDIFFRATPLHDIVVHKSGTQLHLIFRDPTASDVMSRLDLNDPLNLVAAYTQAFMLSLVWVNEPQRVYTLGLGGGRVPMLLHHYFPELELECSEIDPAVPEVAERFFGFKPDERLKIILQDGRDYLAGLNRQSCYDFIFVDGFRGTGYGPYRLATREFYQICREHLSRQGVILVNLLELDPLYTAKIQTFCQVFEHHYICFYQDSTVLIGTASPALKQSEIIDRAITLQEKYDFSFALERVAESVLDPPAVAEYLAQLTPAELRDSQLPPSYLQEVSLNSTIFSKARKDDLCPCDSGKKFKNCHGR